MIVVPKHDNIIEVHELVKKFGSNTVLREINLYLKKGNFLALFGPNGAGKTTLIKILSSLMLPTSGNVQVAGFDLRSHRDSLCNIIGVLSHNTYLYNNLSVFENLKFYGMMYDIKKLTKRIEKLIELVGLGQYMHDRVQTLSRGMRQRLSIARTIIHEPQILFLDEPYTGLDQQSVKELNRLLSYFRDQGKTIIMISHDLNRELELCSHVAILASGTLAYMQDSANLTKESFRRTYIEIAENKKGLD